MDSRLLQKYISGNATEEEARKVTLWISQSDEHRREYIAKRKLFDIYLWRDSSIESTKRKNPNIALFKSRTMKVVGMAAVVTLVVMGTFYLILNGQSAKKEQMQSLFVPAGQRSEILLADGTKVWLNSQSRLIFPGTFDGKYRKVRLEGEAYFKVTKNKEKPFIVETDKYDIKVLGTEFNVTAYPSEKIWKTSLLRGSVEIDAPHGSAQMKLKPNDMATFNGNQLMKSTIEDDDYYQWRDGLICFNNASMKEMVHKLERCYGTKIAVNNTRMLSRRYTAKFRVSDGIEHVIKVLRIGNKFTYHKDDDKNLITIN